MKKTLSIAAGLVVASGLAFAQGGPGPGDGGGGGGGGGNDTGHSWSNSVSASNSYNYVWGATKEGSTDAPKAWSNKFSHTYAGEAKAGSGAQVQSRFGKSEVPADVQTIVRQFQQDRTRLMNQLKTCSDEQRQLLLKEMEQLRTQLKDQICLMRDQAREQAEQMRSRFGNNRDRVLEKGAGAGGNGGRDR